MSERESPLVCICIPTYNAAETITETLNSILNQSYTSLIIKVVDNASTDETLSQVAAFKDSRIQVIRNATNLGGEGNFNRCIELAEGKYTAIYHADDLYHQDIVSRQVQRLEREPELGAVFTEGRIIDEHGKLHGCLRMPDPRRPANGVFGFETLFKSVLKYSNFLICPSAMIHTSIYKNDIAQWRGELFKTSSDLDVWFRVALRHPIALIYEPLIHYRISVNQVSHSKIRNRTERSDFYSVVDYYLKTPEAGAIITINDLKNYRWLEHTDRAIRAVNLIALGKTSEGQKLLESIQLVDSMRMAASSVRGLYTALAIWGLKLMALIGLQNAMGRVIKRLRGLLRK